MTLSSESAHPSSSRPQTPLLSSDIIEDVTPPSSPPGFPWEQAKTAKQEVTTNATGVKNAFAVLGKRKPLADTTNNERAKRPATLNAKQQASQPAQLQLSLGQRIQVRCKTCGMEYVPSSSEDQRLHTKYHKQNAEGYDVGKDFVAATEVQNVFRLPNGDRIVAIHGRDKSHRRKRAQTVLEIVQRELGAVGIPEHELWESEKGSDGTSDDARFWSYLYVRDTKCVGFLLVERITEGHAVVRPRETDQDDATIGYKAQGTKSTAVARLEARREMMRKEMQAASAHSIQLSDAKHAVSMGVSRIWTSPTHRNQRIASSLLDTALSHRGRRKIEVAFSQPTQAGARLARNWMGRPYGWHVYVE